MPADRPNFALFYSDDGYTTHNKIMGRQSAGSALLKGVARRWPAGRVTGVGTTSRAGAQMRDRLAAAGHTGGVRWHDTAGDGVLDPAAAYYPAPPETGLAHARNRRGVSSYSLFGVTHTLSSAGAMDQVAGLILPPYQPWDALICTSHAALVVVGRLQDAIRGWMREQCGATRFNPVRTPVIPLGIDAPAFASDGQDRATARTALGLSEEAAFLFAGRLAFHAKANPAPFYQAIETACRRTGRRLVVIEAGIYPNDAIRAAFEQARTALAPSPRFVAVDGRDEAAYRTAWLAADVFVSLSDNIQETFGLTPVEAMAAGLPVLASDWNGYRDTVRDGVDGFRIPALLPPAGTGEMIAARHALGLDSYDHYIGRVALATAVDPEILADRTTALAEDSELRRRLGEAGRRRVVADFDWPVILDRYVALATELGELRAAAAPVSRPWPLRPDPFALFADHATAAVNRGWQVRRTGDAKALAALLDLDVANYGFHPTLASRDAIEVVHHALGDGERRVAALLSTWPGAEERHLLALMWLVKFGLASVRA